MENFPPLQPEGKTRDLVAKATGFGNGMTLEAAQAVIANGVRLFCCWHCRTPAPGIATASRIDATA